jgi:F-type H+-transporting ATPase subunit epsilon
MAIMNVELVTAEQSVYRGQADQVQVPSKKYGSMGILPGHQSLFAELNPGQVRIKESSHTSDFDIKGGFIFVDHNVIRILAD